MTSLTKTNPVCVCVCRYFETFDVVSGVSVEERVKMSELMAKCVSPEERGE